MPVEIKELVLRATVEAPSASEEPGEGNGSTDEQREEIIAACVREVLRIIERARER